MAQPPIPERIPPLTWRAPVALWLPLSLALSIAWPAALVPDDPEAQTMAWFAGALAFAIALAGLGASWAAGRAPKARRIVVLHVVLAGAAAAALAPLLTAHRALDIAFLLTTAPLAALIGLPVALISGTAFAWLAMTRATVETASVAPPAPPSPPPSPPRLRSSSEL